MALHTQTIILHLLIITVGTLLVPNNVVCGTPILSTSSTALFGIRGGAFFGFGRKNNNNSGGGDGDDDPNNRRPFPALSQEGMCVACFTLLKFTHSITDNINTYHLDLWYRRN